MKAEQSIRKEHLPGFNYDALVAEVNDVNAIRAKFAATDVGYEKIQLFRIFNIDNPITRRLERLVFMFD